MGLPRDATIESVETTDGDGGEGDAPDKARRTECANGHTVRVRFSVQRDLDSIVRDLQTWTRNPLGR